MAATPIIDLDSIDLSKVVITRDEIRTACKQRGEFEMPEGILYHDTEQRIVVGYRDITADDWWAPCHIPGRPIFPGVLQVEGAAQLCTYDFVKGDKRGEEVFVGFAGLNHTRFRGIVEPPCRLIWVVKVNKIRRGMFIYDTQGFVDNKMVFETQIMGVVF